MKMKKLVAALSATAILITSVSVTTWADDTAGIDSDGNLAINATNFPDANFRDYIGVSFDADEDGVLSQTEREEVISIAVACCGISSLTGIEYFSNLEFLICNDNSLTSLDVSKNTALTELECSSNFLTELDVSKNTALTELECSSNSLTKLDVSKNAALTLLYCGENSLTELDVNKNTALTELVCSGNNLTSLDVSANNAITDLDASSNSYTIRYKLFENNTFDLSELPGNFDVTKTSNWSDNCSVSGTTLTVTSGSKSVTYDYDAGNGYTVTFRLGIIYPVVYGGEWDEPATELGAAELVDATAGDVWYDFFIGDVASLEEVGKDKAIIVYVSDANDNAYFKCAGNDADSNWKESAINGNVTKLDSYDAEAGTITVPYSEWSTYTSFALQGGLGCKFWGIAFEDDTETIAAIKALMKENEPEEETTTTTTAATTTPTPAVTTTPESTTAPEETTAPAEDIVEIESEGKSTEEIVEEVKNAAENGDNIVVKADESVFENAADIIDEIKGKDVDLTLESEDYSWTINGKDIEESLPNIDLNIIFRTENIPEQKVDGKLNEHHGKHHEAFQFTIKHNGKFGFNAILTFKVDDKHAGKITNIYYYNEETGEFELITSAEVNENGEVKAPMHHASDYLVVIEDEAAAEGETTVETEEGGDKTSNPATGVSLAITAVFAAVMGTTAAVASKKRRK